MVPWQISRESNSMNFQKKVFKLKITCLFNIKLFLSINSFNKANIQLYLNDWNTFKFSRLLALPPFFFLNMAFQFVALDHSFSTLVVLPLFFFSKWPFNLWPFTIHSQHWWPFQFFSQYGLSLCGLWPFIPNISGPFTFFFLNMAFHLWLLTIHSQHWW